MYHLVCSINKSQTNETFIISKESVDEHGQFAVKKISIPIHKLLVDMEDFELESDAFDGICRTLYLSLLEYIF